MPSPFPGMDPFLEAKTRWQLFHGWFMRKLAEQSLPAARQLDCWIDVERTVDQREPSGDFVLVGLPDQVVHEGVPSSNPGWSQSSRSGVALAEPKAIHEVVLDPDEIQRFKQDTLVVRDASQSPRVLAVVELLSPANKGGSYVPRYRDKRLQLLASAAHFMEIDFLRAGDNPSRRLFPELPPSPYFIFVARKTGLGRNEEGYPVGLQERLPIVGLPLGPRRPDLALDLPAAFQAAYDLTIMPGSIRYQEEPVPDPELGTSDSEWLRRVVGV